VNGDPTHNFFFEPGTIIGGTTDPAGVDPRYEVVERFNGIITFGGVSFVNPPETLVLSTVPEPATLFLLGTSMAGAGLAARWRRLKRSAGVTTS